MITRKNDHTRQEQQNAECDDARPNACLAGKARPNQPRHSGSIEHEYRAERN